MADSTDQTERRGSQTNHPSMIGGHARYIQGAISSTLGYASGEDTKQRAVEEMREANNQTRQTSNDGVGPADQQPVQSNILGTVEQKLGELTGCEGLVDDGKQRMVVGSEEASGTG